MKYSVMILAFSLLDAFIVGWFSERLESLGFLFLTRQVSRCVQTPKASFWIQPD